MKRNGEDMTTIETAMRLVETATGERYGDGYVVTNLCIGYAEPGYGNNAGQNPDTVVIVLGNWNDTRWIRHGDTDAPKLTKAETMPGRLARALELAEVEVEWADEWEECGECHRALRVKGDSYGWTMFGAYMEDACEILCADCLAKDMDTSLEPYTNNPSMAVTWCDGSAMADAGWIKWAPGDEQDYQTGWHPDQTDDPTRVLATVLNAEGGEDVCSVVFLVDGVGQFDTRWSAWFKVDADEDAADQEEIDNPLPTVNLGAKVGSVGVGDKVICGGYYSTVFRVYTMPVGHDRPGIRSDMTCVVIVTENGERALGALEAHIGSDLRMHWSR